MSYRAAGTTRWKTASMKYAFPRQQLQRQSHQAAYPFFEALTSAVDIIPYLLVSKLAVHTKPL